MNIDIQFNPAVEPWETIRDGVLLAEHSGFGTAWVFDHFNGNMLRGGSSMLECFSLLGALAAATTTIGLGSMVVNVANRNPGVMASSAASVQTISGGRLILGLGAGAAPNTPWSAEHRALGINLAPTIAERHQRLSEALDVIERLWSGDRPAELAGFHLPTVRPPLIVGVNSEALARTAAIRTDGINIRGNHDQIEPIVAAALDARATSQRAAQPMIASVWAEWDQALADPDHPSRQRWSALGVNRLVMVCLDPHVPAQIERFLT
jgi:alkanesulfonate monooxygenase SsuD/methylene tetrahydromethanopterin reductase-like flavin-dependent oxidoreductase (luciferase family)